MTCYATIVSWSQLYGGKIAAALIRQYIPKKSNFNDFSDIYIKNVAKKLNLRPRKKLGFSNPKTEFFKQIANFALAS